MTTSESKVITGRIPPQLIERIDELANRLERSRESIVNEALTAWVNLEDERNRLTLEGLADVDAGHVIDHRLVQAWANSLDTDDPLPSPI